MFAVFYIYSDFYTSSELLSTYFFVYQYQGALNFPFLVNEILIIAHMLNAETSEAAQLYPRWTLCSDFNRSKQ